MIGCVLFLDISGFTLLCERLSAEGLKGIESVSHHLNHYFGQMVDIIHRHQGDITKFAGDALIILFTDDRQVDETVSLSRLTLNACRCALSLHSSFDGYTPVPGVNLRLHSALSSGRVYGVHVGGVVSMAILDGEEDQRWEWLLKGKPMRDVTIALNNSSKGDIVLHQSAYTQIKHMTHVYTQSIKTHSRHTEQDTDNGTQSGTDQCYLLLHEDGSCSPASSCGANDPCSSDCVNVSSPLSQSVNLSSLFRHRSSLSTHANVAAPVPASGSDDSTESPTLSSVSPCPCPCHPDWHSTVPLHLDDSLRMKRESALRAYVPSAVLSRVSHGHKSWLAEFRRLTTLFILLPEQDFDTPNHADKSLNTFQSIVSCILNIVNKHRGDVRQLVSDDKGTVMILLFGLTACWSNPLRAVKCALQIKSELQALGHTQCAIGITTGKVFCGTIGNNSRCEYTAVGDKVNQAARLMMAVPNGNGILCDAETVAASGRAPAVLFKSLPPVQVKGKSEPITVYTPYARSQANTIRLSLQHIGITSKQQLIGRKQQRDTVQAFIQRAANYHPYHYTSHSQQKSQHRTIDTPCNILYVEATTRGVGKSTLLSTAYSECCSNKVVPLVGIADEEEGGNPYRVFESILPSLLKLLYDIHRVKHNEYSHNLSKPETDWARNVSIGSSGLGRGIEDEEETSNSIMISADWLHDPDVLHLSDELRHNGQLSLLNDLCSIVNFQRSEGITISFHSPTNSHKSCTHKNSPTSSSQAAPSVSVPSPLPPLRLISRLPIAQTLLQLLVGLFNAARQGTAYHGLCCIIDNADKLESATEQLLLGLAKECPFLFFIFGARCSELPCSLRQQLIPLNSRSTQDKLPALFIELTELDEQETCVLLQSVLHCDIINDDVLKFVYDRSNGIPAFAVEIATQLRTAGIIQLTTSDVNNRSLVRTTSLNNQNTAGHTDGVTGLSVPHLPGPSMSLTHSANYSSSFSPLSSSSASSLMTAALSVMAGPAPSSQLVVVASFSYYTNNIPAFDLSSVPDSMEEMIAARIDELSPELQLLLKMCAVFGQEVDSECIRKIWNTYGGRRESVNSGGKGAAMNEDTKTSGSSSLSSFDQYMLTLVNRGFLVLVGDSSMSDSGQSSSSHPVQSSHVHPLNGRPDEYITTIYTFKHTVTIHVAYSRLPFSVRGLLHRGIGEWYERMDVVDRSRYYPKLAWHWQQAALFITDADQTTPTHINRSTSSSSNTTQLPSPAQQKRTASTPVAAAAYPSLPAPPSLPAADRDQGEYTPNAAAVEGAEPSSAVVSVSTRDSSPSSSSSGLAAHSPAVYCRHRAIHYLHLAAENAAKGGAKREVIKWCSQAVQFIDQLPNKNELRWKKKRLQIILLYAISYNWLVGLGHEVVSAWQQVCDLCQDIQYTQEQEKLHPLPSCEYSDVQILGDITSATFYALRGYLFAAHNTGHNLCSFADTMTISDKLLSIATRKGPDQDFIMVAHAMYVSACAQCMLHKYDSATQTLLEAIDIYRTHDPFPPFHPNPHCPFDPLCMALSQLGVQYFITGQCKAAFDCWKNSIAHAKRNADWEFSYLHSIVMSCFICVLADDVTEFELDTFWRQSLHWDDHPSYSVVPLMLCACKIIKDGLDLPQIQSLADQCWKRWAAGHRFYMMFCPVLCEVLALAQYWQQGLTLIKDWQELSEHGKKGFMYQECMRYEAVFILQQARYESRPSLSMSHYQLRACEKLNQSILLSHDHGVKVLEAKSLLVVIPLMRDIQVSQLTAVEATQFAAFDLHQYEQRLHALIRELDSENIRILQQARELMSKVEIV